MYCVCFFVWYVVQRRCRRHSRMGRLPCLYISIYLLYACTWNVWSNVVACETITIEWPKTATTTIRKRETKIGMNNACHSIFSFDSRSISALLHKRMYANHKLKIHWFGFFRHIFCSYSYVKIPFLICHATRKQIIPFLNILKIYFVIRVRTTKIHANSKEIKIYMYHTHTQQCKVSTKC